MNKETLNRLHTVVKAIGFLFLLVVFGYYGYQNERNQMEIKRSLDEGAAKRKKFDQEMKLRSLKERARFDSICNSRLQHSHQ